MAVTREQVISALRLVRDPDTGQDIVARQMVKDVRVDGDRVRVQIEISRPDLAHKESLQREIDRAIVAVGASGVLIDVAVKPQQGEHPGHSHQPHTHGPAAAKPGGAKDALPQVKHIIAVGAGKGGVGKSTLAVNLAIGLSRLGHRVGLMDGDIYGPSTPTMLGLKGMQPTLSGQKIAPFHVHGIHAVTIGALVPEDKPLIWRGPMAHGAFKQLLIDHTQWPELDYMIVDLPPGTGDVPLTLCQLLPLTGAVVVATPQQVAIDDAVRAIRMFQQLEAPILGIIENMSYFISPEGAQVDIFGRGGAEKAAKTLRVPFLGALPLFTELRVNSDSGKPLKNFEDNPQLSEALMRIVNTLLNQIEVQQAGGAGPEMTIV